jgi:hypothetical protein
MKKRVAVFCEKLSALLKFIRAMPLFVFHRQDWNVLRYVFIIHYKRAQRVSKTKFHFADPNSPFDQLFLHYKLIFTNDVKSFSMTCQCDYVTY